MNNGNPSRNPGIKIPEYISKEIIFYFSFLIFAFLLIITIFLRGTFDRYVFLEWLINYSQGFVRRGLPGAFILFIKERYNIYPHEIYELVKNLSYIVFSIFASLYFIKVKQVIKVLDWRDLITVLFLPSLILFPIYDPAVVGRKEFFFFFGLLINLFFIKKALGTIIKHNQLEESFKRNNQYKSTFNNYSWNIFAFYNLLSIPTALSHEAIIFLGLPCNIIITASFLGLKFSKKQVLPRVFLIYSPTIVISLICLIFSGNEKIVLGICQSLQEFYNFFYGNCATTGPMPFLSKSIQDSVGEVLTSNVYQVSAFLSFIVAFSLNIVILLRTSLRVLLTSIENLARKYGDSTQSDAHIPSLDIAIRFMFKYAFIPFIFSLILYVIGLDWGRWLFIVSITYTICFLSSDLVYLEILSHSSRKLTEQKTIACSIYSKTAAFFRNKFPLNSFHIFYMVAFVYTLLMLRVPRFDMKIGDLFLGLVYRFYLAYHILVD